MTPNIRLVRLLGHGGMGSVWVADHLGLHTQVVVKFVAGELADNPEIRERFAREAALAAQAKSPHVVQVLDHGATAFGVPYIAMELLEGEDLGKRITRQGMIPPALFAIWLEQACKGLGRAHAKGIVHRDIKPENIFLSEGDGETVVKVLDFGIAKGAGGAALSGTRTGAFLGTAYFMSPEQTMGAKHIDLRTDLWSMGVTAYLALTGTRPFESESMGAIVHAITSAPIPPPSTLNPQLGPAIDAWMARALARPLEERFASAKEMADAFSLAIGRPPTIRPQVQSAMAVTTGDPPQTAPLQPVRFSTSVGVVSEPLGERPSDPALTPPSTPTYRVPRSGSAATRAVLVAVIAVLLLMVLGGGGLAVRASLEKRAPAGAGLTSDSPVVSVPVLITSAAAPTEPTAAPPSDNASPLGGPAEPTTAPSPPIAIGIAPARARVVTAPSRPSNARQGADTAPNTPPPTTTNRLKMGLE